MPRKLQEICDYLTNNGLIDEVYESLEQEDHSNFVITVMNVLRKTGQMPELLQDTKSATKSTMFRNEGNVEYKRGRFRDALIWYNYAILCATPHSNEMKFAYSNRSALLFTVKAYKACIKDIDTCLSIGNSTEYNLAERLAQRKQECEKHGIKDFFDNLLRQDTLVQKFFEFKRNPEIPCASVDVGVIKDEDQIKIVAAKDIKVGTVVALEKAYMSENDPVNKCLACHYCHKFELNLIPCENCCEAMFCSKTCKNKCNKEFHSVECKIINCFKWEKGTKCKLATKSTIKLRHLCSSWKEFIEASNSIGAKRIKESSASEILDVTKKFSILNYKEEVHFMHGELFTFGFMCAIILHHLTRLDSYFPEKTEESKDAIGAFARVMVNLGLFSTSIDILNAAEDPQTDLITTDTNHNHGLFPFTGKLNHCCDANLQVLGVNNQVALIAIKPIKKGRELTISYLGHFFENIYINNLGNFRAYRLFCLKQILCNCRVCTEKWSSQKMQRAELSRDQIQMLKNFILAKQSCMGLQKDEVVFKATCEALAAVQNVPASAEHHDLYKEFRLLTSLCQYMNTKNATLSDYSKKFGCCRH